MKNFKLSMLAMLSVIAMTFTSCLGDGDNTQYVTGTGSVSTSSSIVLDNGLTLKTNALNLSMGDTLLFPVKRMKQLLLNFKKEKLLL